MKHIKFDFSCGGAMFTYHVDIKIFLMDRWTKWYGQMPAFQEEHDYFSTGQWSK